MKSGLSFKIPKDAELSPDCNYKLILPADLLAYLDEKLYRDEVHMQKINADMANGRKNNN